MPKQSIGQNLTWEKAIEIVLRDADEPMSCVGIATAISERKLRTKFGATPQNTINVVINQSIKHDPSGSPFEKEGRGIYRFRGAPEDGQNTHPASDDEKIAKKKLGVVKAIGVYWDRYKVDWSERPPRIIGSELSDSDEIDFSQQRGVYLLHDRQGIVYVGQTSAQSLAERLSQHTSNRLASRWDRFSWFGVYGVNTAGKLETQSQPEEISIDMVITSMEAVLIEAIEPRQNRQRGYDIQDKEYIQVDANRDKRVRNQKDVLDTVLQALISRTN